MFPAVLQVDCMTREDFDALSRPDSDASTKTAIPMIRLRNRNIYYIFVILETYGIQRLTHIMNIEHSTAFPPLHHQLPDSNHGSRRYAVNARSQEDQLISS
jgi:hypothetical protein